LANGSASREERSRDVRSGPNGGKRISSLICGGITTYTRKRERKRKRRERSFDPPVMHEKKEGGGRGTP